MGFFTRVVAVVVVFGGFGSVWGEGALPEGGKVVWKLGKAQREGTASRERVCLNGVWRWRPAGEEKGERVPGEGWGWFKVPGSWPGVGDYMQKDSQVVYADPGWKDLKLGSVTSAWYQREIEVPAEWGGRRIAVGAEYVNSLAVVFVDGQKAGEIAFPAGEVDLTKWCKAGEKHVLSMLVVAMPLKGVLLAYTDSAHAREVKGSVARRGLCGDVYLTSGPMGARIEEVGVETSVRKGEIGFRVAVKELAAGERYTLRAEARQGGEKVAEFKSGEFGAADVVGGRFEFRGKWKGERLWDMNRPGNVYEARVSLLDSKGKVVDAGYPERFGFRELWIEGRDFVLNGSRVFLSAVPLDNAQISAAHSTYAAARETMLRLKGAGFNFVYTHNYDTEPGSHLSFGEILRAADDVGMLVALTQPHFSGYDWKGADAEAGNGYAKHAAFYARVAGNHPSVVFYSTSHNATGYDQDMDPDLIDGIHDKRDTWAKNNMQNALRAEAIIRRLDPTRIVYHHAGGNIGAMHSVNFYPNFAPDQELCDWFEHWAQAGVKPLFLCEYGAPLTWDYTMYRGWYKGKREFGSGAVPWEFCQAEWSAQYLGDKAFELSEMEKGNLRWEAKQFAEGKVWHRWDYPTEVGSARFEDRQKVLAQYITDNWRAYRTWGVSGINAWEYQIYWRLRDGVERGQKGVKTDWEKLQRPGYSPDFVNVGFERMDVAYEKGDWVETAAGRALVRNNQGVLAYIAGKGVAFTSKDHNFVAGGVVEKQIVLINNSRERQTFRCEWSAGLPVAVKGQAEVTVETGEQARVPVRFEIPAGTAAGTYELRARAGFGESAQEDVFAIHVMPAAGRVKMGGKVALYDPAGKTGDVLEKLGVGFVKVGADADLSGFETLVMGQLALGVEGAGPDIGRVREGLKVIVLAQSAAVLEKRLGFRAIEYGLRNVFARVADHPVLVGLGAEHLRDWAGESTTTSARLEAASVPMHGPTIKWCDIPVSRVWRCGNRGDVASVLIEKPAHGKFRPIVDGGFGLQYAPLMEYREGKGVVLFCQMEVIGRTESDPAAEMLLGNLLRYVAAFQPEVGRRAVYCGEGAGRKHLEAMGVAAGEWDAGMVSPDDVLIVGPGCGAILAGSGEKVRKFIEGGGRVLAVGLDQAEANAVLGVKVVMKKQEHIGGVFDLQRAGSVFAGIGPADLHNRGPRDFWLVSGGAEVLGDGVLAVAGKGNVVFCQVAPWRIDYGNGQVNLKRTYRRMSFVLSRVLGNVGVAGETKVLDHFRKGAGVGEKRWLEGLYLDVPEEWDDPYRFFRW